ncbi:uncharacterized protein LOC129003302 [Macrosteles quadrilineatus]|uniref:uncharacterized protein LOC129003302 n=1 Tax=Macrosteles quadrilineatus TaxID=74068 RepID=UPI0023E0D2E7|nr:uncharacterized protein LOC129003302 [Macrosteles quadrilineatus]
MVNTGSNMNAPISYEKITWSITPVPPNPVSMKLFLPPPIPFSRRLPAPPLHLLPTNSKHNSTLRCPCSCKVCHEHSQNLLNTVHSTRSMFDEALNYITSTMDSLFSALGVKTLGERFF